MSIKITGDNLQHGTSTVATLGTTSFAMASGTLMELTDLHVAGNLTVLGTQTLGDAEADSLAVSGHATFSGELTASMGMYVPDDKKIYFGNDFDASIEYDEDGTDELRFAGAAVTFEQAASFDGAVTLGNATGDTITVTGRLGSDLVPSTDGARDLGASGLEWKDLYIDGVAYVDSLQADQLGAALDANSQAITNINVDSGAIDGAVIGANSAAAGTFTTLVAGGNVDLGAATSDTITATGRFDSDLVPSSDSARALGSSDLQWSAAHVDVGHIDQLGSALDANSQAITNINVDSGAIDGAVIGANSAAAGYFTALSASNGFKVTDGLMDAWAVSLDDTNGFKVQSVSTFAGNMAVTGTLNVTLAQVNDSTLNVNGATTLQSTLTAQGNVDLGSAVTNTITATGRFDSDLVPSTDGARDLGASGLEWKDLYIDGVAYVDSLQADQLGAALDANSQAITNINVDSGAIDGAVIGANSAAAGTFTTLDCTDGAFAVANLDIDGATDIGAGLADADLIMVDDGAGGTNRKSAVSRIPTYLNDHTNLTSLTSLVAAGALNAGSITSGFGNINNGSSTITSTGLITAGKVSGVGLAVADQMTVGGNSEFNGNVAVTGTLNVTSTAHFDSTVDIQGNLTLSSGADVTAQSFITYSDATLKTDIKPLDSALDKVMSMRGVSYEFKSDNSGHREVGFLAQEMQNTVPEVVYSAGGGTTLGIDYAKLTSVLVEAVKAQQEQINELKLSLEKSNNK